MYPIIIATLSVQPLEIILLAIFVHLICEKSQGYNQRFSSECRLALRAKLIVICLILGCENWVKFVSDTTEPATLVYRFIGLHRYNTINVYAGNTADLLVTSTLSPYSKFKMALKSKEVQRQYPNLLQRFLDFCNLDGLDVEQKALEFSHFAKVEIPRGS